MAASEPDPGSRSAAAYKSRAVLAGILSPGALRALRAKFEADAMAMVAPLAARGEFDAIAELADAYPFKVFPEAVGLEEEGRDNLVLYGRMVFAGLGPQNASYRRPCRTRRRCCPTSATAAAR